MSILAKTPCMGFNTWNTFGTEIDEKMIIETVDAFVKKGYQKAGYQYIVIDDYWSLRERDENGKLVPDPKKFPHGMKYIADYVHKNNMKFGMYSCAGIRTCGGYPGSYDYEYVDAETFASFGVDFLKYDFCNFPAYANCRQRYLTMAQALRSTGRDIVFAACNAGIEESWEWMRSIGANMYRSTRDINDTFESTSSIIKDQTYNYNANAQGCFNDMDMLTVGMEGRGNVSMDAVQTYKEYETQFAYWCFCGAPLMIGADVRNIKDEYRELLQNPRLIALNQDEECRPPYRINKRDSIPVSIRHLSNKSFAICIINFKDGPMTQYLGFAEMGVPASADVSLHLTDVVSGEDLGLRKSDLMITVEAHGCRILKAQFEK